MAADRRVLGSLDLLPEECQDDIVWAIAQLNKRERTQADILFELNDRLAVKGHGPISKSAFSRRSVRLKRRADRLAERDHLYAGIRETITSDKIADHDLVLSELLKTIIDEMLDDARTAKEARELTTAFRNIVAAQSMSLDLKAKANAAADKKVAQAVDAVAKAKGMSAETAESIKSQILGVKVAA